MATPFNQGVPSVPVVLNTSNVFVFGNTASGNALSVQQLGTGNVATFRTTTGATALFVNAAGNVGVGTANPIKILHGYAAVGSNEFRLESTAVTIGMGINAGNNFGFIYNRTNNPLVFGTNDAERMRITETGNVGIGNTTPPVKLWVPATSTTTGIGVYNSDVALIIGNAAGGTNAGSIQVKAGGSSSAIGATNYRLALNPDGGTVGIGTTDPGYLLDVSNSTASTSTSFLALSNPYVFGFNTGLNIGSSIVYSSRWQGDGGSGVVEMCKIDGRKEQNANFGDSYLAFQTRYVTDRVNGGAGTLMEKMRITGNGNVGIGTTSPSTKLSVEGATSTAGRNDVGMTLNVNVNDATLSTTAPNAAPFGINVLQSASGSYRFCQFNSGYTPGSGGSLDAEFIVYGNGNVTADGSYTSPADYAEMFEWEDGNPDGEDRVGYSVILSSGNKIRKSESTDSPDLLIGVISGRPAVCADTAWNRWADKYLKDDFNRYLMEEYEVWKWTDDDGKDISYDFDKIPEGVIVPENKTIIVQERYVLNPNYDPSVVYTPRMERKEWSPVGMVGKLSLLSGQLTGPRWIKLVDFSPSVSQWLIR
jgi:hypothetical protein